MNNTQTELHTKGYVILQQKVSIQKPIFTACKNLFSNKKITYTFNGPSGGVNDKKRYSANVEKSPKLNTFLKTLHASLEQNKIITNSLYYNYSHAFVSNAGCSEQHAHSDYLKTEEFVKLIESPRSTITDSTIARGDRLLYTKDAQNPQHVNVNQVHLDDYPNYYYTIAMPDGTEKQTTIKYLLCIPDTVEHQLRRLDQIPIVVLTAIMDNTRVDVWENSIGWMKFTTGEEYTVPVTKKTIVLQKGEICIMRGDLIHAGSAYENNNYRLYSYYDNINVMNDTGTVSLVGNDAIWEKQIH